MSARRRSSQKHCRRASAARDADRTVRDGVYPLPQACVELLERRLAGAQLLFAKRVERRVDGAQVRVQVFGLLLDIKQAGDDLPLGSVVLQEAEGRGAVVHIVVRGELAQRKARAVMLFDDLDRSGLLLYLDRHAARDEIETVDGFIVLPHEIEALGRAGMVVEGDAG